MESFPEAEAAKKELLAEIGKKEWTSDSDFPPPLPDDDEPPLVDDKKKWTPDSHFPPPIPKERGEKRKSMPEMWSASYVGL